MCQTMISCGDRIKIDVMGHTEIIKVDLVNSDRCLFEKRKLVCRRTVWGTEAAYTGEGNGKEFPGPGEETHSDSRILHLWL